MNRDEVVRMIVLTRICDDYEEPELLHEEMVRDFPELAVEPIDIRRSLRELIQLNLASAWRLSATAAAQRIDGVPPDNDIDSEDVYFMATKAGIAVQANNGNLFDENRQLVGN